jgi:hypothetical protein
MWRMEQPIGRALNRDLHGEEVDQLTEASWKESERRAQARRARENHKSYLDNEKHLRDVYYGRYLEKHKIVQLLERRST